MAVPVLTSEEFSDFFLEVHGYSPFPWQKRLAAHVARTGDWPEVLDLPTGAGKTAVLDIAVFQLALDADRGVQRGAPIRAAFVVDRRLIVDDSFRRAEKIATALSTASPESVVGRVAGRLRQLSGDGPPLLARRLRGGIPLEDDWARTPAQPTILCSTVDQVGSRLLFRGYGVSDRSKPIHAGLIGSDCRIFLDEAHLAEPFRQTLDWVKHYRSDRWQESPGSPWGVSLLTATPRGAGGDERAGVFRLTAEDYADRILGRRWTASKPTRLVGPAPGRSAKAAERASESAQNLGTDAEAADLASRSTSLVAEVEQGLEVLRQSGLVAPAIGVVVNRVRRAREVFERLKVQLGPEDAETILLIGPARPVDRDDVAEALKPIRTGDPRTLAKPLLVVATQCIEAGVDIDLDGLITEAAPLDALRQRFGRLNRDGRNITPFASVVAARSDLRERHDDPVYGRAVKEAWQYLTAEDRSTVDFGLSAFEEMKQRRPIPPEACSDLADAPVLMPAHLDLLSQTAPIPLADPEVGLYLHGPAREPASVSVVWRADVNDRIPDEMTRRLLLLVPPRSAEAIELPVWAVRRWLTHQIAPLDNLADVPAHSPDDEIRPVRDGGDRHVFRWAGDDDRSVWIAPSGIRPGDTIVVPSAYGGADEYGWNPRQFDAADTDTAALVPDVGDKAAEPFAGRRFSVRVAPGLLQMELVPVPGESIETADERLRQDMRHAAAVQADRLREALAEVSPTAWRHVRDAVMAIGLPEKLGLALGRLDNANGGSRRVEVYTDLYGSEDDGPRGVVFVAPLGVRDARRDDETAPASTEDDVSGSMPGFTETLDEHSAQVEVTAERFARLAGLPDTLVADLKLAGFLHDAGKADLRFQALLASGDPLGANRDHVLAKSGRRRPRAAGEGAGLPARWRHEALSVRIAPLHPRFVAEANTSERDSELVLWLIGTHHGWGRPLFPHTDPLDDVPRNDLAVLHAAIALPGGPGPQSLVYDHHGVDWAGLYERLKARYGVWDLARLEAILRLADHRASEAAEIRAAGGNAP